MASKQTCGKYILILFVFLVALVTSLLLLEVVFFSSTEIAIDKESNHLDTISILIPSNQLNQDNINNQNDNVRKRNLYNNNYSKPKATDSHNTNNLHLFFDPSYDPNKDWFNASNWHSNMQINFSCPVYENICVYNQHFYVHSSKDEFDLDWKKEADLLGTAMPNLHKSAPIYKKFFHATTWEKGEYESAHCTYHSVYNHLILESHYQTMLGEFYARTLRYMHYLKDIKHFITDDIQLWLLIGDQKSLYVSHYLFTERFSVNNLLHFTNMFDHIGCQCFHRILFCGFHRKGHEIAWPRKDRKNSMMNGNESLISNPENKTQNETGDERTYLIPLSSLISRMEPKEARDIFPGMITEYNQWIDEMDFKLNDDIRQWKYEQILNYKSIDIDPQTLKNELDEWRFIGLYDRKLRRSWLKITTAQRECNERYNEQKIFCHIIVLEDFLHSRDVIIIHRASFMLIGVHGAQLTDAIWMDYKDQNGQLANKYIIELLPYGGPKYTNSISKPTALGVLFWGSHYNHVGLKLANDTMQHPDQRWDANDFYVHWWRLSKVIDFLIMDEGGFCKRFDRTKDIIAPKEIDDLGFAVYNAYCVNHENPKVWHGVAAPRLY